MANTTNLDLVKPLGTDHALISQINGNMDKIDAYAGNVNGSLNSLGDGLAIIANGDTHAAITSGQFVYVRGHNTLAEGLYTATTNIAANGALSLSNLTADASGGLNALNSKIRGNYIDSTADLNDYDNYDYTGLYNIGGTAPTNCPNTWVQLLVIASNTGVSQMIIHENFIKIRRKTGSPAAWTAWRNVLLYDTGWVTLAKDGSNSYAKYRAVGNVVTVIAFHKVSSGTIGAWTNYIFGQIPSSYRPTENDVYAKCVTDRASSEGCSFIVGTNGNVYISGRNTGATDTTDVLNATVTYVINE